jgi:type II secretory pathway component PulM
MLGAGGLALVLVVGYLGLEPYLEERRRLEQRLPELRQELAWMQDHVAEARALAGEGNAAAAPQQGELTPAVVEGSLRRAGLAESLDGLRPQGEGVRVVFKGVTFPELLGWLRTFQRRNGAVVHGARIERAEGGEGRVQARLTLGPREEPG